MEHPPVYFGLNGDEIDEIDNHCHLRITFQSSATRKKHIYDIYKKACSRLLLLRQVKHLLDRYSLIHIYFTFIRPVLEYGDVVWGNCTKKESDLLEIVQIEAGRIITGLGCNSSRQKVYHELGWETLENRRKNHELILFYRILNGLAPAYLYELVQPYLPRQSGYKLRNENNTFHPPFSRTSSFYDSFIPFTIRLWNTLPLTITESPSLNIFKNRFYETWDTNAHYNFGIRKFNIIHCQLRNEASNLKAHLFNDFLSDNTNCPNCSGPLEDNNHFLLNCPKFNNLRLILLLHGNISSCTQVHNSHSSFHLRCFFFQLHSSHYTFILLYFIFL